ncbi:amidohydrolase [Clostridium sp. OM02-18AC]|uniref:amidohydrolase n=1 Tax=Clostridium sp. OM02-18AC TaxID=2292311 RepID=UPI000E4AA7E5|nr:amidohydrolase [Clostridium sp. OM02-18AC]RHV69042.1 amidohydrolase [Clostridium sp. OM02-18AC]
MNLIAELAEKYEQDIIELRRYFHQHPETAWEEFGTTDRIEEELRSLGLTPHRLNENTGLWVDIKGRKADGSEVVLLRADIDALPIQEMTGLPYASQTPGKMHACGHDCHAAMLLGAAKIFMEIREAIPGTVRLLFQPAEEGGKGAQACIRQGVLEEVTAVYGCHVGAGIEAPYFNLEPGPRTASADDLNIIIHGYAAHASAPHRGHDAVLAAGNVLMCLQTLVSRHNDPLNPLVVTMGTINGGQKRNIIADEVRLEGTVRTFSNELRKKLPDMISSIVQNAAAVCGCTAEVEYIPKIGVIVHDDPKTLQIGLEAAKKLYGENFLVNAGKVTASDDFADYLEHVPGIYPSLGIRNEEKGCIYGHHNGKFCVDESALKRGAAMFVQFAIDYLADLQKNRK